MQITDADGKVRGGNLVELASGQLTLGPVDPVRLKTRNLVLLKFKDRTASLAKSDPIVLLSGGDILALQPESIDDEALTGRWARDPQQPAVKVPLESVRGVIFNPPVHAANLVRLLDLALDGTERHDSIVLNNGDILAGELNGLSDKELTLKTQTGNSVIDRRGVRAIIFNPMLTNSESLRGEGALVALVDGSRFRARDLKLLPHGLLSVHPQFGGELNVPLDAIESLRFLGGCATYLSDMTPADFQFEPFFELDWPLRRDRAVAGGFLKLRGVEYPKGLGLHSRSTVTYRLDGKYRRFRATIGIDDVTAGKGNAVFEVLLDGKVAFQSEPLTGSSPAASIEPLDLTGVKSLSLRVDFGADGDILDHADWGEAVVLK